MGRVSRLVTVLAAVGMLFSGGGLASAAENTGAASGGASQCVPGRSTIAQCFPDNALAQGVAFWLKGDKGKTSEVLTAGDVEHTGELSFTDAPIVSAQGLQVFTNLYYLDLSKTRVSDATLSSVAKLTNLVTL